MMTMFSINLPPDTQQRMQNLVYVKSADVSSLRRSDGLRLRAHDSTERAGCQANVAAVALAGIDHRRLVGVNPQDGLGTAYRTRLAFAATATYCLVHIRDCGDLRFGEFHNAHNSPCPYTLWGYYSGSCVTCQVQGGRMRKRAGCRSACPRLFGVFTHQKKEKNREIGSKS